MNKIIPVLLCLILALFLPAPVQAMLPVNETELTAGVSPYEVNPDSDGWLWISDFGAGEVWYMNPQTGAYTIYSTDPDPNDGLSSYPADARRSGEFFWWVDGWYNEPASGGPVPGVIGRAAVSDGAFKTWQVTGVLYFYGTAVDASGRLWASDGSPSDLYRLEDTLSVQNELCIFTIPDNGQTYYIAYRDPYLWLGDFINSRLLRLNVYDNKYVYWQLPNLGTTGGTPFGMTVDADGHLWYADDTLKELAELDPQSGVLTHYVIPTSSMPQMVAVVGDSVWYTGHSPTTIGVLDSLAAAYTTDDLFPTTELTLTPACSQVEPHASGSLQKVSGTISWTPTSYPVIESVGWQIYRMPDNALPWGITYTNGMVYVVHSGLQKLVEFDASGSTETFNVFLPLITR